MVGCKRRSLFDQIAKVQPLTANPFRPKFCSVINVDTITSASSYSLCCRQFVYPLRRCRSSIRSLQHRPKPLGTALPWCDTRASALWQAWPLGGDADWPLMAADSTDRCNSLVESFGR